jgi:hypothetical protein
VGPQFDGLCVSVGLPLSIIELASRYGSLANFLCGLALGAVAFMLGKKEAAPPHTIALLSSGVIVLAADSFLFAAVESRRPLVVGSTVSPGTEYVCYQSWTLAMPAIGMLMVGTAVLVASIGWMIIQYAVLNDVENKVFASLGGIFTLLAVVMTTLSVIGACSQYLAFINFPARPSIGARVGVLAFGLTMVVIGCGMIVMRTVGLYRYRKYNTSWGDIIRSRFDALAIASISTAAYGLVGIVFDAVTIWGPSSHAVPGTGAVWSAIVLCLILPWIVYLPICYAVPGTNFRDSWKRYGTQAVR